YDGPHSPERTRSALEAVDALVRYANNATSTGGGVGLAPQVYDHLCELSGAIDGLPQLLAQLQKWADTASSDGTLRHDQHRADADRGEAVAHDTAAEASRRLAEAGEHARTLAAAVSAARSQVVHLCHDLPDAEDDAG